jgi:hypothetical protein
MRILVLNEDGSTDARELFDVAQFRISYTCPNPDCGHEFIFRVDGKAPSWNQCPACGNDLKTWKEDTTAPRPVLWDALSQYRNFYRFVTEQKLALKLVVVSPDLKPAGGKESA